MKEYLNKLVKVFSRYRDWLLVVLVVGGIAFFLQQIQAEQQKDPEDIWQAEYPNQVDSPVDMLEMPGGQPGDDENAGGIDLNPLRDFDPMDFEEIESISNKPIFTHSSEYKTLLNRLEQHRTDFQDAQDRGDTKNAIARLRLFVEEDPHGELIPGWTTEPHALLRNLICTELVQSVEAALSKGEENRQAALAMVENEPDRAIETIRNVRASVERTLREVESNPDCLQDARIPPDRIDSLESLQTRVAEDVKSLEDRLVRQKYDRVLQQASALGPNSLPDQVAQILQSIQEFRNLLKGMGEGALSQSQIDRLTEIENSVESNKDSLINQVQQQIDRLTAEPDAEKDLDKIAEILRQFSVLRLLGESDARSSPKRRQWEQISRRLEAANAVEKLQDLVKEIKSDLDKSETLRSGNQDVTQVIKRINISISQFKQIRKNTKGVSSVPAFKNRIYREYRRQERRFDQLKAATK